MQLVPHGLAQISQLEALITGRVLLHSVDYAVVAFVT